ncbi:MAG TPA: hypothetical protein VKO18_08925 [Terriglobia bacterium]|nr:hypothetical protein [Terriglobia bacterium]
MTSQTPDMQAVLERLEKLERQNRTLKRAGLLAFAKARFDGVRPGDNTFG